MKVSDLIERLSKLDQNATVLVWHSYQDELTDAVEIEVGRHIEYKPEYYRTAWYQGEGESTVLISY